MATSADANRRTWLLTVASTKTDGSFVVEPPAPVKVQAPDRGASTRHTAV